MRSSSRHFRIVFPGCSERVISPAIFSRSGNCMGRARKRAIYKRVEETIGVCRHRACRLTNLEPYRYPCAPQVATEGDESVSLAQRLYEGLLFASHLGSVG